MTLSLVSPGVKVREVDLTIGRVDAVSELIGGIAGPFEKGPVSEPILIENEQDLLKTFGKPISSDRQYEYWMSASSYLSYGGILRVIRTDDTQLNNANATGSSDVKIKSYEDYVDNQSGAAVSWKYAAKDPGRWANKLKVCQIDAFADQTITVGSGATDGLVGMGITQTLNGRIDVGAGATSQLTGGFVRGVITGVDETKQEIYVKINDTVSAAGTATPASYQEGGITKFENTITENTTISTGIATAVLGTVAATPGISTDPGGLVISGIATLNANGNSWADIGIGDIVTVTGGNSTVPAGTTVIGIGASTLTVDRFIIGISTSGDGAKFSFERVSTASTTSNPIYVVKNTGAQHDSDLQISQQSAVTADWYDSQKMLTSKAEGGSDSSTVYWKQIAPKPGTSQYASEHDSTNDEIHVVVVDDEGSVTGIAGNIVEKHLNLSKAKDGKISPSENIYYRDSIALKSDYIYAGSNQETDVASGITAGSTYTWTAGETDNWSENAQGNAFSVVGNKKFTLTAGENYSSTGGFESTLGDVNNAYSLLKNETQYDVNFLIMGPGAGTKNGSIAKAKKLIEIADLRKDCIACISPHREDVVGETDSDVQTTNVLEFFSGMNSSYAVFDGTWKYVYDRFNNQFVYIPCNSDTAGLMARTSINQFSWFSPAGAARGTINSAIKLAYNPSQAQRDQIYPKAINPIILSPGAGIVLFGDRTGLKYASAFDRINVRRLFLTIERTIEIAARSQLFEFNDVITRSNFVNIVEPYLRDIKSKRGITDFVVICDETNNTPDIIDANQFKADIFVKPARSINFIGLTFVATRTGVSFEEVVGNV